MDGGITYGFLLYLHSSLSIYFLIAHGFPGLTGIYLAQVALYCTRMDMVWRGDLRSSGKGWVLVEKTAIANQDWGSGNPSGLLEYVRVHL